MMMMLISKKIMMKQPKHFPFSKTNICPCSQQTFYLAERTRETEARQLWVVGRSEVGRCLVGSGRWVVGGRLPQRWGRAGEVSSKQTHNYSYSCVCLFSLLCALQTKLPILTHRPPLLLRLYSPPPSWPHHPLAIAVTLALSTAFSHPFRSHGFRPLTCNCMRK